MFNYFENVHLTLEMVKLYKPSKSVEINSVGVNSTPDLYIRYTDVIGQCSGPGELGSEYIARSQSDSLSKFKLCSRENSVFLGYKPMTTCTVGRE